MLKTIRWLLITLALAGSMSAQTPTANVHDYLKEVRIFAPGSPDFAKITSTLGVDATLPTLVAGASLVAAIRNDSGQAVELRVLFQVTPKGGKPYPHFLQMGQIIQAGGVALTAPPEVAGALAELLNAGRPRLFFSGSPSLAVYQGAQVTISVDSATLASGKFIGADTRQVFDELVAADKAKRQFFSDLTGWLSAGQTQAQIEQALTQRKDATKGDPSLAALAESDLSEDALYQIGNGMASLASWATKENAALAGKPSIHR